MMRILQSRENIPLFIALAVVAVVFLTWFSPAEATLGQSVKMIYIHAALMWVGFGLVTAGGILGLLYLFRRREAVINWSNGCIVMGLALLMGTSLLGIIAAKVTWGAVFWAEPRMAMLGRIFLVGLGAIVIGRFSTSRLPGAVANATLALISWVLVIRTERVIHPRNPIFTSDSTAIKVFPVLIAGIIIFAAVSAVRYWLISDPD